MKEHGYVQPAFPNPDRTVFIETLQSLYVVWRSLSGDDALVGLYTTKEAAMDAVRQDMERWTVPFTYTIGLERVQ